MTKSLTKKQKQVYESFRRLTDRYGYTPSYEEVAAELGLSSVSNIQAHVENLVAKGFLVKKRNANRSIDFPDRASEAHSAVEIPLAGIIAAGSPIEAVTDSESMVVPADMLGKGTTFALKVSGDSMIDDHVLDGDFIIVEARESARAGEMVVALIRGSEATLKRFYREGSNIRLEPANPRLSAQIYDESDVAVQGVVVGIIRKYRK